MVDASQVFDFLDHHRERMVKRYVVSSPGFNILRHNLRSIVMKLYEGDDIEARELAGRLRALLSEWLTVPVPFSSEIPNEISVIGSPDAVQARWGRDIRILYDAARQAAINVVGAESPARSRLGLLIRNLRDSQQNFRIYCHKTAAKHFESLLADDKPSLGPATFLHSVRDYRETEPFDVLIKFGPLRSGGWGVVPDAILSAPRFKILEQVVWSGCSDEPGFGYDPVTPLESYADQEPKKSVAVNRVSYISGISWTSEVINDVTDASTIHGEPDIDELQIFRESSKEWSRRQDYQRATLVHISDEQGIFYPRYSQVPSFDPDKNTQEAFTHRLPNESLLEGMFLVRPLLRDTDFDERQAAPGHYSRIWKDRLNIEYQQNAIHLCSRLQKAGLNLVHLDSAVRHWCTSPTTVIHAPQQRKHFEILIRFLGIDFEPDDIPQNRRHSWWEYAWYEIQQSRGEAIQAGMQEHENIDAQLVDILNRLREKILNKTKDLDGFIMPIPIGEKLQGYIAFNKVHAIEEGFSIPPSELRSIQQLKVIAKWRD